MEILKDDPIIDQNYKPHLKMTYMEYFNRAMLFAQTNYAEQLSKLANTHFRKITPTVFFEEYTWCVCTVGMSAKTVSKFFPKVITNLAPYYKSFWDTHNFPIKEIMDNQLHPIIRNRTKIDALWNGARIINNGIRLFGWDKYRDHYLSDVEKLKALPLIGSVNSFQLARNIGLLNAVIGDTHLNRMTARWGFVDAEEMCKIISNHVVLQPKVIGLILWYAGSTFGTNIQEP